METGVIICDDTPREMPEEVKNMTDEEAEAEFERIFGQCQ